MTACRFLDVSSVLLNNAHAFLLTCLSPELLPESMQQAFRRLILATDIPLARPKQHCYKAARAAQVGASICRRVQSEFNRAKSPISDIHEPLGLKHSWGSRPIVNMSNSTVDFSSLLTRSKIWGISASPEKKTEWIPNFFFNFFNKRSRNCVQSGRDLSVSSVSAGFVGIGRFSPCLLLHDSTARRTRCIIAWEYADIITHGCYLCNLMQDAGT